MTEFIKALRNWLKLNESFVATHSVNMWRPEQLRKGCITEVTNYRLALIIGVPVIGILFAISQGWLD